MPKKGIKKQQTLRRKKLQSDVQMNSARKYAVRTLKKRQQNRLLSSLRKQRQENLELDTGSENLGWLPEVKPVSNVPLNNIVEVNNNQNNVNTNGANYNRMPPTASWMRTPRKKTLKQQKRTNLFRNRSQKQRQREKAIQKMRSLKRETAELENAGPLPPLNNNSGNYTTNEEVWKLWDDMALDYNRQEKEYEELQRQHEIKVYKEAKKEFYDAKPNTFYIRFDKRDTLLKASEVLPRMREFWNGYALEILYKGTGLNNSYYYYFQRDEPEDDENDYYSNNSYGYGYGYSYMKRRHDYREKWFVVQADPVEFFKPIYQPKYYGWGGDEWEFYRAPAGKYKGTFYYIREMKDYIRGVPGFMEKVEREKQAVYTAPPKLETLQLKAAEAAANEFEKTTGRQVPQDVRNQIESYLRTIYRPQQRYFQTRDNLSKINTSLFTNNQ